MNRMRITRQQWSLLFEIELKNMVARVNVDVALILPPPPPLFAVNSSWSCSLANSGGRHTPTARAYLQTIKLKTCTVKFLFLLHRQHAKQLPTFHTPREKKYASSSRESIWHNSTGIPASTRQFKFGPLFSPGSPSLLSSLVGKHWPRGPTRCLNCNKCEEKAETQLQSSLLFLASSRLWN